MSPRSLTYLTPADVHYGRAATILQIRHHTRLAAYAAHPERFVRRPPEPPTLPAAVWINPPASLSGPRSEILDGTAPPLAIELLTASRIDVDQGGRYLGTPSNEPFHAPRRHERRG